MHNDFESLLKRCKAYKRKKMLQKIGVLALLLIAIGAGFWFYDFGGFLKPLNPKSTSPSLTLHVKEKSSVIPVKKIEKKMLPKKETLIKKEIPIKKENLAPKPIRKDVSYEITIDESYLLKRAEKKSPKETKKQIKVPAKKIIIPREKTSSKVKKKKNTNSTFTMSTKKLVSTKELLLQYKKEPQYDLALKISQTYFDEKKFSKSSLWAKKANMLNRESDIAWIMYAKSEYARGNKDQAKEILQLYLGNRNSKKAEMLLMTWNQGE